MSDIAFQMTFPFHDSSEIFFPRYDSSVTFVKSMLIKLNPLNYHAGDRQLSSKVVPSSYFPVNNAVES